MTRTVLLRFVYAFSMVTCLLLASNLALADNLCPILFGAANWSRGDAVTDPQKKKTQSQLRSEISAFSRFKRLDPAIEETLFDLEEVALKNTLVTAGKVRTSVATMAEAVGLKWDRFEPESFFMTVLAEQVPNSVEETKKLLPVPLDLPRKRNGEFEMPGAIYNVGSDRQGKAGLHQLHEDTLKRLGYIKILPLAFAGRILENPRKFFALSEGGLLIAEIENENSALEHSRFAKKGRSFPGFIYRRAVAAAILSSLGIGPQFFGTVEIEPGVWALLFEPFPRRSVRKSDVNIQMFQQLLDGMDRLENANIDPKEVLGSFYFSTHGFQIINSDRILGHRDELLLMSIVTQRIAARAWMRFGIEEKDVLAMAKINHSLPYISQFIYALEEVFGRETTLQFVSFLKTARPLMYEDLVFEYSEGRQTEWTAAIVNEYKRENRASPKIPILIPMISENSLYLRNRTLENPFLRVGDAVGFASHRSIWEDPTYGEKLDAMGFIRGEIYKGIVVDISKKVKVELYLKNGTTETVEFESWQLDLLGMVRIYGLDRSSIQNVNLSFQAP